MSKRFTDSAKWSKPWFRALPPKYKCLWVYMCDSCDIAGMLDIDLTLAEFMIGEKIDALEVDRLFGKQVEKFSSTKWRITDFIQFQYGELRPTNNFHKAVIAKLSVSAPNQPLTSPCSGALVKDKEEVKVKDKVKEVVNTYILPDWMPLTQWEAYIDMRIKKRAKPTAHAISLIVSQLDKWRAAGQDVGAILDQSIRSNWTDVYELKRGNQNGKNERIVGEAKPVSGKYDC